MTPQALAALGRANEVRLAIAELKRGLRAGLISLGEALEHDCSGSMRVYDLLVAQPKWGHGRATRFLALLQITPIRRVRDLSVRQRDLLCVRPDGRLPSLSVAVLRELGEHGRPVLAMDIADAIGVSPRGMGGRLVSFEAKGWVTRVPVDDAGTVRHRLFAWEITEKGRGAGFDDGGFS